MTLRALAGWLALFTGIALSVPWARTEPQSQPSPTQIIANARKIVSPNGIERLEMVKIGGIPQWVSVRGEDRRNPVLLFIHGGPGYISMPMSWWFARGWEDYFTVVQWDQRGAGKTFLINDPRTIAPTMTRAQLVADAEEMAAWARRTLGKRKIFVLGHSWGSYPGIELALHHPDWLYAYIGVGQITNGPESEHRGWVFARNAARRAGNAEALRELDAIAPYPAGAKPIPLKNIYMQRRWLDYYGGVMAYRRGNEAEGDLSKLSPDYTAEERARIWEGHPYSESYLLPEVLNTNFSAVRKLDCPVIIFAGRHDVNVNSDVAADWFAKLSAPSKQFVWFENSAHLPMTEEPGKFLVSLVRTARPFAERAGDVAPQ